MVTRFGMVPVRVLNPADEIVLVEEVPVRTPFGVDVRRVEHPLPSAAVPEWLTPLTCIFLHGGWMHVIGNLWFLWIFGDNVEDRFGHVGYLIFYLASGVAASLAHLASSPGSPVPTIGASGAIAGVMGAYMVLYPKAKVQALLPLGYLMQMMVVPAPVFLGIWFLIQFFQGAMSITSVQAGGVAWWAHIGGFAVGAGVAFLLKTTGVLAPPVEVIRAGTEHSGRYRVHLRGSHWR